MTFSEIVRRFDGAKITGENQAIVRCPCHADAKASLSIGVGGGGKILFYCHAGCQTKDILDRVGLKFSDVMPEKEPDRGGERKLVAAYDYRNGTYKLRYSPKGFSWQHDENGKRVAGRGDAPHVLYERGEPSDKVYICEGEKDVENVAKAGLYAVSSENGAGKGGKKWFADYNKTLLGKTLVLLSDNDDTGRDFMEAIAAEVARVAKSVKVLDLARIYPDLPDKGDISDVLAVCGADTTRELLEQLERDTPEWKPTQAPAEIAAKTSRAAKAATVADVVEILKQLQPHVNYEWTDRGAGQLFGDVFKSNTRYNTTAREWYSFTGKEWELDAGGMRAAQKAKLLSDALLTYCATLEDGKTRSDYTKYVAAFGRFSARETMLKDARSEYFISQTDLDQNKALFNCQNGTLDLDTGEFREHRADDLLSKISGAYYEPNATSELFERFMSDIMQGDADKIRYLQRIFGYCLTAENDLETCWFLYGKTTRNGKSTLVETISHMMGDYALSTTPEVLALKKNKDSRNASGDIARLDGARFLSVPEPPKKMLLDVATLKTLTGRDTIVARRLYQAEFEFEPVFKLVINTNFLPIVSDETLFNSNRVNVITFDRHFEPSEQDTALKSKLRQRENVSGILNWCLQGLRDYHELGLVPPDSVTAATEEYRESSDKLGLFLSETMESTGDNTGAGEAYKLFSSWCTDNGFGVDSKSSFFDSLKNKGLYAPTGTVNGSTVRNVLVGYTPMFTNLPF